MTASEEFSWTNLQTGEKLTFPDEAALRVFLAARAKRTALAGSGEPQEKVTGLPEDYWETAQ